MEKLNLEQMEKIRGGFEPAGSDVWSEDGQCFRALKILLTYGYDPGDIVGSYWDECSS